MFKRRALCLDPLLELAVAVERVNADAAESSALLAARFGVDDGRAVGAALTHPEAAGVFPHRRGGKLARHLGFEPLGALVHHRGQRIVDRGGDGAEQKRRDHRGCDELPGGNAGRARNDQFEPARQRQIAGHRADQHRERHDALGKLRHAEHGNFRQHQRGGFRPVRAAAQQLDIVDHRGERDHAEERADDGFEKAKSEIA